MNTASLPTVALRGPPRDMSSQSKISRFFASRAPSPPPAKRPRTQTPPAVASETQAAPSRKQHTSDTAPSLCVHVSDVAARQGLAKLTPLEQQVVSLKASAADALLLVEVGYKFIGVSA